MVHLGITFGIKMVLVLSKDTVLIGYNFEAG